MTRLLQDLRYALRTYIKAPAFTAVAVLVLGLGIGANSAIFTLVNALLFQPLSGRVGELVGLYSHDSSKPDSYRGFSYPNYVDIRSRGDVFQSLMAHGFAMIGVPTGDTMRRTFAGIVSSNYFETLGVTLAAGRPFTAEEERPGARSRVVITTYGRWVAEGRRQDFIGSTIRINADDFTVVGVTPERFTGTMAVVAPEFYLPLGMFDVVVNDMFKNKGTGLGDRGNPTLILAGRLEPGLEPAAANARLKTVSKELEHAYPAENRNQLLTVSPLPRMSTSTSPQSDGPLAVATGLFMALSGIVLLIASLNLANMMLARGTSRQKEIAVRLALGASRGRIVRQLLTESLALAIGGAAAGLLLGFWAMDALIASLAATVPMPMTLRSRPDATVLLATAGFAMISTLFFGLGPALRLSRRELVTDLKDLGSNMPAGGRLLGVRNLLVIAQLALSLMLLIAGGLFARAAVVARLGDPGYKYDRLLLASVDPSLAAYDEIRGRATLRTILERVRALPGIEAAGMSSTLPFGEFREGKPVERVGARAASDLPAQPTFRIIGADYFRALNLPLVRGREFTQQEEESRTAPGVAIIDEALARHLFGPENPVGHTIRLMPRPDADDAHLTVPLQVVGIAAPVREEIMSRTPEPHIYVPSGRFYRAAMHVHVRTARPDDDARMLAEVRREIRQVDARLPLVDLTTMAAFHKKGLELWLVEAGGKMFTTLGVLALLLAVVGVYGVKSYVVSQRTREIGIRMALGADPRDVVRLILKDGAKLTAVGLGIGLPLAALISFALTKALYGVMPLDPIVFVSAPLILGLAALLASFVPARRAARVEPLKALRSE
jgi:predicted permease